MYYVPQAQQYGFVVGQGPTAPTTTADIIPKVLIGLGVFGVILLGLTVYIKFIDPVKHRNKLMKQREKIIALAYYDVIKGEKGGEAAQDWILKQFQSTSGLYEDEMYDAEGIRIGKSVLTKDAGK